MAEIVDQKRAAFRVNLELPVRILAPVDADAFSLDMSVTGILIDRIINLPVGDDLPIAINVTEYARATDEAHLQVSARIARHVPKKNHTALEFVGLTYLQEKLLSRIISERQRHLLVTSKNVR